MRTAKVPVYTFDELSDKAKEKARDWFREHKDGKRQWTVTEEAAS